MVRLPGLQCYSRLQLRLNIAYCVTMCSKNFPRVELHGNNTAWSTQEPETHAGTLHECHIRRTQFPNVQTQLQSTVRTRSVVDPCNVINIDNL